MKNLWTIFLYELKKIWMQKLTWVVAVIAVAFTVYSMLPQFTGNSLSLTFTDADGTEISRDISDQERFQIEREGASLLDGQAIDDEFFLNMQKSLPEILLTEDVLLYGYDYSPYFYIIDPTYFAFSRYMIPAQDLASMTAEKYYGFHRGQIEESWNEQKLSDNEIAYWEAMVEQVEQPLVYHDIVGARESITVISYTVAKLLPLLIGVCLCSVFPQERRTRMSALIFTAKEGRFPVYFAKVLAGIVSVIMLTAVLFIAVTATGAIVYDGVNFHAALMLVLSSCWPITMGQAIFILLGLLLIYALLCGSLTIFVSLFTGSRIAGLIVSSIPMVVDLLMPYSDAPYLPGNLVNPSIFMVYRLVGIPGFQLNWVQFGFLLYGGSAVALLALCWLGWRKNAAAGR